MSTRPSLFPSFFLSGFECSSFDWKRAGRRNLTAELQHDGHADEDYAMLAGLDIRVAREGIPWPLVDRGNGDYERKTKKKKTENIKERKENEKEKKK